MMVRSYGDMAQFLFLRNRSVDLNDTRDTLTKEVSTGIASNLPEKLGGDLGFVTDLERSIAKMDSYNVAAQETALFASTSQMYIGRINDNAQSLGTDILALTQAPNETTIQSLADQSRVYLNSAISNLNGQMSGRSLFSGTDTAAVPLESANTLMSALQAEVSGLTDPNDIVTAVEDWFSDPAGFDTVMYNGSNSNVAPVRIGSAEEVSIALRADDDRFKDALMGFALGAMAGDGTLGLPTDEAGDLLKQAGVRIVSAQTSLTEVQADLGFIEHRIEETQTRNAAALTSMTVTLNDLTLANMEESSTRLKEVEFQLEALYKITVRSSELNLLNYM